MPVYLQIKYLLRTYTKTNFFKHTYCEYIVVNSDAFTMTNNHYISKGGSLYYYTEQGVYRYSNHWGRVANCRWKIISGKKIKSQNFYTGFALWTDFYSLNESEKQFYIAVDFDKSTVNFHHKGTNEPAFLFFAEVAQKKVEQIRKLFSDDKWAKYFNCDIAVLRKNIITQFINSNKSLQEIKREHTN